MKIQIKLLLTCILSGVSYLSYSQSFCAGITVEEYPMNPQTGSTDRYGVKVTLDQVYDQNVSVFGGITRSSGGQVKIFNLTVPAGSLSAQTASNFYGVPVGSSVTVSISSITPTSLTKQNITYGTGCTASDPSDRLDTIGKIHNDFQEFLFTYITDNNLDLSDTTNLKSVINTQSTSFFASKGMSIPAANVILGGASTSDTIDYNPANYSVAGNSILNALKNLILSYDPANDAAYFTSLDSLKNQALSLSDPTEVYSVGLPVTIAIYSTTYWEQRGQYWLDLFAEQDSIRNSGTSFILDKNQYSDANLLSYSRGPSAEADQPLFINKRKCGFKPKQTVAADVSGGVSGFVFGAFGTPLMSLIGGGIGAGVSSGISLGSQALACLFNW